MRRIARLLEEGRENLRLQRENGQLALQTAQYEGLRKSIEETRHARHDLQHHLNAMRDYLDRGDIEKFQAYQEEHTSRLSDIAARYGGVAKFKWEDGIFYAAVMLDP